MKKVVISLVTLSSIVLLAACGQSKTETQTSASSKAKTSQTSSSAKRKSSSTSSEESSSVATSAASSEASATQKEAEKPAESRSDLKDVTNISSFAGTWANDLGQTVTVNADGSAIVTSAEGKSYNMALKFNHDTQGAGFYTIYTPGESIGSAAFIYIPAGITNPHIGTIDEQDTLVIGQDVSADEHPYYRQ